MRKSYIASVIEELLRVVSVDVNCPCSLCVKGRTDKAKAHEVVLWLRDSGPEFGAKQIVRVKTISRKPAKRNKK